MADAIKNAKQFPKIYYCRHMLPGVAGYESENLYIDTDAMKNSAPSMQGKPVYVNHQPVKLGSVEYDADGWITDCFYNELDGWLWARFLATTDAAHRAIASGWSVSNAYLPQEWDGKGQHLSVDYDRKIRNYEFTHLAIVPNPRYEEAKIFTPEDFKAYQAEKRSHLEELKNSKPKKGHPMFKFFQKKDQEISNDIAADADLSTIEIEVGGKRVLLSEIVNTVKKNDEDEKAAKEAKEKEEKENKKPTLNDDTEVCVGDEKMSMKDLVGKYNGIKKNAEDEELKKKEKENAEKEEKEKEEKEKKNSKEAEDAEAAKRFEKINNAHNKKTGPVKVEIQNDKVARGNQKYGSSKK